MEFVIQEETMSDAFNERLRLIRFRRKRERSTFREELRVIPRWLIWTCAFLYLLAVVIGLAVNIHNMQTGGPVFPDDSFHGKPEASSALLLAAITCSAI